MPYAGGSVQELPGNLEQIVPGIKKIAEQIIGSSTLLRSMLRRISRTAGERARLDGPKPLDRGMTSSTSDLIPDAPRQGRDLEILITKVWWGYSLVVPRIYRVTRYRPFLR
jgi:hypothetical protein